MTHIFGRRRLAPRVYITNCVRTMNPIERVKASISSDPGRAVMIVTAIAVVFVMIFLLTKSNTGSSGMVGQYMPHIAGLDMISDKKPALLVKSICQKCGSPNVRACSRCGGCANCRAEDKCGDCQDFQRQVSLDERSRPCAACGRKPCKCPSATGRPVMKEPGVVRGVFSEPTTITY